MSEQLRMRCDCGDENCTATILRDSYESLDHWRAEFQNETDDPAKDAETQVLAGWDLYIVAADHANGYQVMQRYGASCVIARDLE